ncbi:MAG: GNAT family N-acetyltransferase [Candidatus Kariarchaeaceae archaeon]
MSLRFEIVNMNDYAKLHQTMGDSFKGISIEYLSHPHAIPPGVADGALLQKLIPQEKIVKILWDRKIVGGYHVIPDEKESKVLWLQILWVDPSFQGNGIGKKTWKHIEKKYPTKTWKLETPEFAISNQIFYEKLGFVKINENVYEDVKLFVYEKKLSE